MGPDNTRHSTTTTPADTTTTDTTHLVHNKNGLRKFIETSTAVVVDSNCKVIGRDVSHLKLTKFNKIGGHSIIYKYDKYIIKEIMEEHLMYEKIMANYPQLSQYLPLYLGTVKLQLNHEVKDYIVLEDLTNELSQPFVVDLKMGTRQYGIHSPPEKVKSQKLKCKNSTSLSLGIRLCGLQIINKKGNFELYDKYYGRQLNATGFLNNLVRFLNNKSRYTLLIKCLKVVEHLKSISSMIESLDYFRLYGSSILIIYDNMDDFNVIIKLIDFSKSFFYSEQEFGNLNLEATKDYGYLKGIFNLIESFKVIFNAASGMVIENDNERVLMETIERNKHDYMDSWNKKLEFPTFRYQYDDLTSD
ncbi:inositol polyphosphate kinase kcs1 [Yamadazyma tenuis]|uniref:Kinase n=1 Tax=Candida tenuis (strain ATCC 10573 / BCRC 21748 / CBS 615 / JCM 9827 / NBRC 10315 / NRRL Y-1498 / VKM Y-70) TaxID=590646 RepID=G3B3P9_CANTC|nr:SAICAR synthase-like protein [Yamadazyma tenuis ATCC 10573]EGV64206.1 SAICAR synthase-like protein [Yamadazyma tenuis ATCC 10573]WEJ96129.1 inositol polyphosphate kinase kcs1 [Yamadazyma tenuis]